MMKVIKILGLSLTGDKIRAVHYLFFVSYPNSEIRMVDFRRSICLRKCNGRCTGDKSLLSRC